MDNGIICQLGTEKKKTLRQSTSSLPDIFIKSLRFKWALNQTVTERNHFKIFDETVMCKEPGGQGETLVGGQWTMGMGFRDSGLGGGMRILIRRNE